MDRGAVTFLDVLGWKGIWTRDDEAIGKLRSLIAESREAVEGAVAQGGEHIPALRGYDARRVQIESISDTIVLFTPGDAIPTLWLHGALCQVILCSSMDRKIPVRGATCYGDYATEDRIMVGPAIDEAASWHEAADWIGVIQTPSAYLLYTHPPGLPALWVEYAPPLKSGRIDTRCVDWSRHWRERLGRAEPDLTALFTSVGPLDTSIAGKYLNTFKFYKAFSAAAAQQ
jgi:hypothetical protein